MRVLGVDLGSRRIGLAISDADASFSFPLAALESAGFARDVAALCALISEREVGRVVVGLPLHMDGRAGRGAEAARRFASALATAAGVPVELIDERWTTAQAERALMEAETGRRQRREARKSGQRDSMAAAILLRTWLERESSAAGTRGP